MLNKELPEIRFIPDEVTVRVRPGISLLEASRIAKVSVRTRCGGKAGCLMCKVKVADQQGIEPPTANERNKLGSLLRQGVRLACQAKVRGNVTVEVPEDPLRAAVRKQLAQLRGESTEEE